MYGQNLGVRPDAPGEPIFTKFCLRVRVPYVFLSFEFQEDRVKNVGAVGVDISPLPLKRHIAYVQQLVATAQAVIVVSYVCIECCTGPLQALKVEVFTVHQWPDQLVNLLSLVVLWSQLPWQLTSQVNSYPVTGSLPVSSWTVLWLSHNTVHDDIVFIVI